MIYSYILSDKMAKQKLYWTDEKIAEIKAIMDKAKQKKQPTKTEKEAFAKKMMSADAGIKKEK